ncbi:MAG: peptidoglycan DD-metalloendopeptidase family protein [Candidatus Vogelbacteria bacterium]
MMWSREISRLTGIFLFLVFFAPSIYAATVDELRAQINGHTNEIKRLETEIAGYQRDLTATTKTASGLQGEINRLELTRKKLAADIKVTENKIARTDLEIEKITLEIGRKNQTVDDRRSALAESLREWRDRDNESLFEIMLGYNRLADFWNELDQLSALQRQTQDNIVVLRSLRTELEVSKSATEKERAELARLRLRLADQKVLAEENKAEKDRLLKLTKNQEANYRRLLATTKVKKDAFERELFDFESQLRIIIDPKSIPLAGKGILAWPLDDIFITQRFGKTVDAKRLYVSGTHNGVDFRATVGTPVKAVLAGVITGVGDTDRACPGTSYGKWVLIKHANGLSTVYGHLSLIKAVAGETVTTGQIIAYSGSSGYSTGPHLHLGVLATQGVKVGEYASKSCAGAILIMPLISVNAYLDPLIYL